MRQEILSAIENYNNVEQGAPFSEWIEQEVEVGALDATDEEIVEAVVYNLEENSEGYKFIEEDTEWLNI